MFEYFFVEFYNFDNGDLEHNAVIRSFEEMAALSEGRVPRIMGRATVNDYIAYQEDAETAAFNRRAAQRTIDRVAAMEEADKAADPKLVRVTNTRGEYYDGVVLERRGGGEARIKFYVLKSNADSLSGTTQKGTIIDVSLYGHEVREINEVDE